MKIRRRILLAFEQAETERDPDARDALMTFAVIGGDPTGVEVAGMIAEIRNGPIAREFRNLDIRNARVILLEAGSRVLASFPATLGRYTGKALENRGVDVFTGQPVTNRLSYVFGKETCSLKKGEQSPTTERNKLLYQRRTKS